MAPRKKKAAKKNGVTTLPLAPMQIEMLRDASQAVEISMNQQRLTLAAVLAGHGIKLDDVPDIRMSQDGTSLEYGGTPEA